MKHSKLQKQITKLTDKIFSGKGNPIQRYNWRKKLGKKMRKLERYDLPSPKPEYVSKLVCSKTGFLSNQHCPTVEIARFLKGKEPLIKCTLHKEK